MLGYEMNIPVYVEAQNLNSASPQSSITSSKRREGSSGVDKESKAHLVRCMWKEFAHTEPF